MEMGFAMKWNVAASSGTILYDPYNADSTPLDSDKDTIPDVIDDDNDNDGWPDDVELDRGSDIYDRRRDSIQSLL